MISQLLARQLLEVFEGATGRAFLKDETNPG